MASTPGLFSSDLISPEIASSLPESYTIRALQKDDYARGFLDCLRVLTTVGEVSEERWNERYDWMSTQGKGGYYLLVIEDGNRIVGTGALIVERKFIHNLGVIGHIEDIAVAKDQQGKKLGLKIIKALDFIASKVGCYKSILDCSEANEGFYVKCGFKRAGLEMAHYYEETKALGPLPTKPVATSVARKTRRSSHGEVDLSGKQRSDFSMDGSTTQGVGLQVPGQDAAAQPERPGLSRTTSAFSTSGLSTASTGRARGFSLRTALFLKNVETQQSVAGEDALESQPSTTAVASSGNEESTNSEESIKAQSFVPDFNVAENEKRKSQARLKPRTASKRTSLTASAFSKYTLTPQKELAVHKARVWYKKYIFHGILRQREILPTKDGRHIDLDASRGIALIDERTGKEYINNAIRSSRYTILTFIPYQLWFQFSKIANFYFLVTGVVQLIPGLSTTGTYTTILPLLFFLCFSIFREGFDDYRRYKLDKVENRRPAHVLYSYRPGGVEYETKNSVVEVIKKRWNGLKRNGRKWGQKKITQARSAISQSHGSSDAQLSAQSSHAESNHWTTVRWIDLKVGDIIELKRDDPVPADIVLLHADGQNGSAFIETMALDGETNLKVKQPSRLLADLCGTLEEISNCRAHFVVEDPNLDLYDFNGKISINGETLPLTPNNVVYRGSTLRNTTRAFGMIINAGEECKIRMNASKNPQAKAPAIQVPTNRVVIVFAVFVVLLSVGCTAGYEIWTDVFESQAWYLDGAHLPPHEIFIAFAIQFNNLIPLALYVSMEIIKFAQFFLLHDIEMYDPVSDTPMVSNTQTIFENLGQVNYIFSDKTGTLTENVMRFRKISVAGTAWLHNIDVRAEEKETSGGTALIGEGGQIHGDGKSPKPITLGTSFHSDSLPRALQRARAARIRTESATKAGDSQRDLYTDELIQYIQYYPNSPFAQKARIFLLSLALCHTCFPETQQNGKIGFQAASPDELALVEAAQDLGYIMIDRVSQSITLSTFQSGSDVAIQETYEVLDVIEFSSKRKRMSIIVKFPDGRIHIFCKGADSVIQPRLRLSSLALQKASQVRRSQSQRRHEEAEEAFLRKSEEQISRNSFQRSSFSLNRADGIRRSMDPGRSSISIKPELSPDPRRSRLREWEIEVQREAQAMLQTSPSNDRRPLLVSSDSVTSIKDAYLHKIINSSQSLDDAGIFERCFQHVDDFASEGLRTLLYGYRRVEEEEYTAWKRVYHHATTSLVKRQEMVEAAGEMIERNLDLAGATAIEDKLQIGVPETIDKLHKANIKIWMLTGDKRETAINIAHSARICKTYSHMIILDHSNLGIDQQMSSELLQITTGRIAHSVVVIDGQTLAGIESQETLTTLFYELLLIVDSVICCRASPSQKATMVKKIRERVPGSITLAIGDGGNDIAMIQEAHVGIGISGKEGLQAARVADYSIAQFRFLQRLLLVHGHWNYVRTANYILYTFWKEMVFYCIQVMYQRWNGYTGTSLYENNSLIVWNTLLTSLAVMIPGIFEQDLSAATLLAVPELYSYGQQSRGFNIRKCGLWMLMAAVQSQIIYFMVYGLYGVVPITRDQGIFAIGDLAFSVCVVFINLKLLIFNYHYKTWIPIFCAVLTIGGWWVWNLVLSVILTNTSGPYTVYRGFTDHFGKNPTWWAVHVVIMGVLVLLDLVVDIVQRRFWPSIIDVWQELEQNELIRKRLKENVEEGWNVNAVGG